jgi:DNA adenine methylase
LIATLKAPFPAFGGKSKVAPLVWERLGDVDNAIEPFANSAAWLLARPHTPKIETLNDWDCYVANFWRATKHEPELVAEHADNPVNEADLHARHRWLVLGDYAAEFRQRMRSDPHFYDAKVAGYWVWGSCCWIGSGWCAGERIEGKPQLADFCFGRGVNAGTATECGARRAWLVKWLQALRDRLRTVRVCCGDWLRVCDSPSVTTRHGLTGVFLDPPYRTTLEDGKSNRDDSLYASDKDTDVNALVDRVQAYCAERGSDPLMRIAVCGYEAEGYEALEALGWTVEAWKASGGYGNQSGKVNDNASRERIWFSPHCVKARQQTLFT